MGSMVKVETLEWSTRAADLLAIRHEVFVREQKVPAEEEVDELDPLCLHVASRWFDPDTGNHSDWIGTARLTPEGRIGRMAVLASWRGRGVGRALLLSLIDIATERGLRQVVLLGQVHALPFYERHGFTAHGPVIVEAGINHRAMTRQI